MPVPPSARPWDGGGSVLQLDIKVSAGDAGLLIGTAGNDRFANVDQIFVQCRIPYHCCLIGTAPISGNNLCFVLRVFFRFLFGRFDLFFSAPFSRPAWLSRS
jgi:hypothetical protein